MKKQTIKLNEAQLRNIIRESITKILRESVNTPDIIQRDLYSIEMIDGHKEIHILFTFMDDVERAPFVRIDFTGCYVELNEFISEVQESAASGDYRDYINWLQEQVKQYEYEFNSVQEMLSDSINTIGGGNLTPLDYTEITEDTPCGLYITKSRMVG